MTVIVMPKYLESLDNANPFWDILCKFLPESTLMMCYLSSSQIYSLLPISFPHYCPHCLESAWQLFPLSSHHLRVWRIHGKETRLGGNAWGGISTDGLSQMDSQLCNWAVGHLFHLLVGFACWKYLKSSRNSLQWGWANHKHMSTPNTAPAAPVNSALGRRLDPLLRYLGVMTRRSALGRRPRTHGDMFTCLFISSLHICNAENLMR